MTLIYIYDGTCNEKVVPRHFDEGELLIAPIIVNNQPWIKGYFEFVENISVSGRERNLEFGFWDVLRQEYVDIQGKKIREKPKYCGIYGLGSYGIVGEEVQEAIQKNNNFYQYSSNNRNTDCQFPDKLCVCSQNTKGEYDIYRTRWSTGRCICRRI